MITREFLWQTTMCVIFGSNNSFRVSCSFPSCSRVSTIIWNRLNYYVCYWHTVRCRFEKQCKCLILKNMPSQILEQKQCSFLLKTAGLSQKSKTNFLWNCFEQAASSEGSNRALHYFTMFFFWCGLQLQFYVELTLL